MLVVSGPAPGSSSSRVQRAPAVVGGPAPRVRERPVRRLASRWWIRRRTAALLGSVVFLLPAGSGEGFGGCVKGAGGSRHNVGVPCDDGGGSRPFREYGSFWRRLDEWLKEWNAQEGARAARETERRREADAQARFASAVTQARDAAARGEHHEALRILRAAHSQYGGGAYYGLTPEYELALYRIGLAFAENDDYVAAYRYLQTAAADARWHPGRAAKDIAWQIEPYAKRQAGGREVLEAARRQEPGTVSDPFEARRKAHEAWDRRSRELSGAVMEDGEARPARPEEKGLLGGRPEVKLEDSGLAEIGSGPPTGLTSRRQLDAAVGHGESAKDAVQEERRRSAAHREASRMFDRHGDGTSHQPVPVPEIGQASAVIVDARGVAREVPPALLERTEWQELAERERRLRDDIDRRAAQIEALERDYNARRDSMGPMERGRLAIRIQTEKQKESEATGVFADIRRRQTEMIDSFAVDFTERGKGAPKGAGHEGDGKTAR